jgi:hypothetical protein
MPKPQLSTEQYLQRIRDFYAKHKRAPHTLECGQHTYKALLKEFPSWDAAVQQSIKIYAPSRSWTRNDIAAVLRSLRDNLHRLPTAEDLPGRVKAAMQKEFGNITDANEAVFGTSMMRIALIALNNLLTPHCDRATSQEVRTELDNQAAITLSLSTTMRLLQMACVRGLVISGKYSRIAWWSLTNEGRVFLKKK